MIDLRAVDLIDLEGAVKRDGFQRCSDCPQVFSVTAAALPGAVQCKRARQHTAREAIGRQCVELRRPRADLTLGPRLVRGVLRPRLGKSTLRLTGPGPRQLRFALRCQAIRSTAVQAVVRHLDGCWLAATQATTRQGPMRK
jgi:hypothetical protein